VFSWSGRKSQQPEAHPAARRRRALGRRRLGLAQPFGAGSTCCPSPLSEAWRSPVRSGWNCHPAHPHHRNQCCTKRDAAHKQPNTDPVRIAIEEAGVACPPGALPDMNRTQGAHDVYAGRWASNGHASRCQQQDRRDRKQQKEKCRKDPSARLRYRGLAALNAMGHGFESPPPRRAASP